MTTVEIVLVGFLLLVGYAWHRRARKSSKEQLDTTCAMCDADEQLYKWCDQHPHQIFNGPEAQQLLRKSITAERQFAKTHPFVDMTDSINQKVRLLIDGG